MKDVIKVTCGGTIVWKASPAYPVGEEVVRSSGRHLQVDGGTINLCPGCTLERTVVNLPPVNFAAITKVSGSWSPVGGTGLERWLSEDGPAPCKGLQADDRYPHECPRCGRKAYVGLTQVEHYGGAKCAT